ncbi:hypothetical protein [Halorientalis pallida]|uniref:hypothetical protein n=1 Tax=Halorientalis pallida TaxID=2479928 RepID=UPI00187D40B0|nr:hypothetical protein [Halorientalis pallida]
MTDLGTLEARIADLEATVEAQRDQIDQHQTDLERERQGRRNAESRVDNLEITVE